MSGTGPTGFQDRADLHGSPLLKSPGVLDAAKVAEIGYRGLQAGKRVVIAGKLNAIGVQLLRVAPRNIVTKVAQDPGKEILAPVAPVAALL